MQIAVQAHARRVAGDEMQVRALAQDMLRRNSSISDMRMLRNFGCSRRLRRCVGCASTSPASRRPQDGVPSAT